MEAIRLRKGLALNDSSSVKKDVIKDGRIPWQTGMCLDVKKIVMRDSRLPWLINEFDR